MSAHESDAIQPAALEKRYDEIYARLCDRNPTAKRLRAHLERRDRIIDDAIHQRHLVAIALRSHLHKLKKDAAYVLRRETGLKVLPGFRAQGETHAQFRARLNQLRRQLGERAKQIDETEQPEKT